MEDASASKAFLLRLNALGCTYEGMYSKLFSVDVPPRVPLEAVSDFLQQEQVEWEYADPKYEDLFPGG